MDAIIITFSNYSIILHLSSDVASYTNFAMMKKNLSQNCDDDDDKAVSMLEDMLHENKRMRKEPSQLLKHSFIKLGEDYVKIESQRLTAQSNLKKKVEVNV